jgi:predicted small lipoprotein YifL
MRARARTVVLAVLLAAAAGCGQQGPLALPGDARPVERVEPRIPSPEQTDDEEQDER